jgi:hypothetical protein
LLSLYLFIDVKEYSTVDATPLELRTYFRFFELIRKKVRYIKTIKSVSTKV